ncbi:M15 family metallopeptidase [Arcobacter sp. LA11]|uniref:M15 family metallopeptidase n=1 Tax=Arcobacter sp. LA11 TaxID=1898176 RepID=UPI0009FA5AF2|nr:M15 family metallopeptidase [Arcobacter sp. LA11]
MIEGNSYKKDCPIELNNLRYLNLSYIDFEGNTKIGELIVHKDVSIEIVDIFKKLYETKYPIYKMELVSNYKGNDFDSIEANNTSAYNCRNIEGTTKWSRHAYGKAIDINPIQNPYISKTGNISHKESLKYEKRAHINLDNPNDKSMILKDDYIVKVFKKYRWVWGGDWRTIKDYQHFDKRE